MSDFFSYLFAIFVVTPLQAELNDRLPSAELMDAARNCVTSEGPRLLEMAEQNWGWAAANAIGVGVGMVDPVTLLSPENADCAKIIRVLRTEETEEA
ncbi:hypothetical protein GAO09_09240 [Rhizobiales bacterium RZME27]|uniref:Uncharacterized protein n=1 Tax=Endobacterium cereale TaxID=2663029 RepID=A0A6A8A4G4_9HYPH|nr:hypothetical protein [Endobacterium cereale]MEB2843985.1 hypothetical protein [Endobacterium cereale]MQY46232.1 hypothetical protein [Endobacterium cereale]